jgi:hypothetical protein
MNLIIMQLQEFLAVDKTSEFLRSLKAPTSVWSDMKEGEKNSLKIK